MLKSLKALFDTASVDTRAIPGLERRQLQVAVAQLLLEAGRADYEKSDDEFSAAKTALVEIFGLDLRESAALLEQGREKARQLTSLHAPLTVIKREFSIENRIHLVEHLWRIVFADGQLHFYEDHYVRKIAHLLYIPNTQTMLARNRAKLPASH